MKIDALTTNEAAQKLGIAPVTVRKAIYEGRLTSVKVGNGRGRLAVVPDEKFRRFKLGPSRWRSGTRPREPKPEQQRE